MRPAFAADTTRAADRFNIGVGPAGIDVNETWTSESLSTSSPALPINRLDGAFAEAKRIVQQRG